MKDALGNQRKNTILRQHLQEKEREQSLKLSILEKRINSLTRKRTLEIWKDKDNPMKFYLKTKKKELLEQNIIEYKPKELNESTNLW
jgi:hypothetical protein